MINISNRFHKIIIFLIFVIIVGCGSKALKVNSISETNIINKVDFKESDRKGEYWIAPSDYTGIPKGSGTWYVEPGKHEFTELRYNGKNILVAKGEINIKYKTGISLQQKNELIHSQGLILQYRDETWDYVALIDKSKDLGKAIANIKSSGLVIHADPNSAIK